ncbi:hypothetical protein [Streptosporangium sp. NPDC000396]|uniref:hypothetical protein n=1 Tax=Streptosporangium sp. NPDC000396 TaxID=3366185 RepID=UPI003678E51E
MREPASCPPRAGPVVGSGKWDGTAWDKDEVSDHLVELAKQWVQRDAGQAGPERLQRAAGPPQ